MIFCFIITNQVSLYSKIFLKRKLCLVTKYTVEIQHIIPFCNLLFYYSAGVLEGWSRHAEGTGDATDRCLGLDCNAFNQLPESTRRILQNDGDKRDTESVSVLYCFG